MSGVPSATVVVSLDPAFDQRRAMAVGDAPEQIVGEHRLLIERFAAPLQPRQVEQVPDDRLELVRFLVRDVEILGARRLVDLQLAHAEGFHVAADRRKRRHELVRDVGEQLAPRAIRFRQRGRPSVEVGRHPVERRRERAHFVPARLVGADVGAPFAKRPRGCLERSQPAMGRPEDQERHDRGAAAQHADADPRQRRRNLSKADRKRGRAPGTATMPVLAPFTVTSAYSANGRRGSSSGRPPRPPPPRMSPPRPSPPHNRRRASRPRLGGIGRRLDSVRGSLLMTTTKGW